MEHLSQAAVLLLGLAGLVWYVAGRRRAGGANWLAGRAPRQIQLVDRIALTHHHSVHLIEMRGRWMALSVGPNGCRLLESGPASPAQERSQEAAR